jgi:hypothetical protein
MTHECLKAQKQKRAIEARELLKILRENVDENFANIGCPTHKHLDTHMEPSSGPSTVITRRPDETRRPKQKGET